MMFSLILTKFSTPFLGAELLYESLCKSVYLSVSHTFHFENLSFYNLILYIFILYPPKYTFYKYILN